MKYLKIFEHLLFLPETHQAFATSLGKKKKLFNFLKIVRKNVYQISFNIKLLWYLQADNISKHRN